MRPDPRETLVPPGEYRVSFLRCEEGFYKAAPRWFCHFQITAPEGPHFGLPLLRVYNVPTRQFLPLSHNLQIDYGNVIGKRAPRGLRPEQFLKDCEVVARVVTVNRRMTERGPRKLPEGLWYSKIDEILAISSGSPPCLRRVEA